MINYWASHCTLILLELIRNEKNTSLSTKDVPSIKETYTSNTKTCLFCFANNYFPRLWCAAVLKLFRNTFYNFPIRIRYCMFGITSEGDSHGKSCARVDPLYKVSIFFPGCEHWNSACKEQNNNNLNNLTPFQLTRNRGKSLPRRIASFPTFPWLNCCIDIVLVNKYKAPSIKVFTIIGQVKKWSVMEWRVGVLNEKERITKNYSQATLTSDIMENGPQWRKAKMYNSNC